ncbi:MAG: hypothetical protein P8X98_05185 [Woeseiaceae bacterium]|jgi:hypothetical protein
MAARVCKFIVIAFLVLYLAALFLLAVGTFGLFGVESDPLSGVYLLPLGLPWALLLDDLPDTLRPWLGILAPAVNLAILIALCRFFRRSG